MPKRDSDGRFPTLKDVAERANVSRQTISRVINNKGEVSEETRQRVMTVIRELGYQPNSLARSLATNKSMAIGLVVPNIGQPFFPEIARGVEDEANNLGYSVFLCTASGDEDRELRAIERLRGHRVAGVISFNSHLTDDALDRAVGGLFPVVVVNRELPGLRGTVIWPGYEGGGFLATEHLIKIGRRNVAYLGLSQDSNIDADKFRGYQAALWEADIPYDDRRVVWSSPGVAGRSFEAITRRGHDGMAALWERPVRIDAVFASNDLLAIGAMGYAREQSIAVPGDVAIVGFGGSDASALVTPTLSTIAMPLYEMGVATMRSLVDIINDDVHGERVVKTGPELVVRESSAIEAPVPSTSPASGTE